MTPQYPRIGWGFGLLFAVICIAAAALAYVLANIAVQS